MRLNHERNSLKVIENVDNDAPKNYLMKRGFGMKKMMRYFPNSS